MVIGLIGLRGSGKTTIGDYIAKSYDFVSDSFAISLKKSLCEMFGWENHLLEGRTDESRKWRKIEDQYWSEVCGRPIIPEEVLQQFGTDICHREFSPYLWISGLINRYHKNGFKNTVVHDFRFYTEIRAFQWIDLITIRVNRGKTPEWVNHYLELKKNKNFEEIERLRSLKKIPHESETDLIDFEADFTIENIDGEIQGLYDNVDRIMHEIVLKTS